MLVRRINSGAYATVYENDEFAFKILDRAFGDTTHTVLREGLLLQLGYGVGLHGYLKDSHGLHSGYVMERASRTLKSWRPKTLSDVKVLQSWARQILGGLASLHEVSIIHGDIKQDNILILGDGSAVLCDFGLSALFTSAIGGTKSTDELYSPAYRPPEMLVTEGPWTVGPEADLWALGVMLYGILCGPVPWYSCDTNPFRIIVGDLPEDHDKRLLKLTNKLKSYACADGSEVFAKLLATCLSFAPKDRLSACGLLQLIPEGQKLTGAVLPTIDLNVLESVDHEIVPMVPSQVIVSGSVPVIWRPMAASVARLVLLPENITQKYSESVGLLFSILYRLDLCETNSSRAVVASALAMYLLRPASSLRTEVLAKLASTSSSKILKQIETCIGPALLEPSWTCPLWPSTSVCLGPDFV